jgi:hypothetical protein
LRVSVGTPFIAAVKVASEPVLAAAALKCMSKTVQYPFGSAQVGTGYRAALVSTGLVLFSTAVSTWTSPDCPAELTAFSAATSPFPGPRAQALYACLHCADTAVLLAAGELLAGGEVTAAEVAAAELAGAAGGALVVHAVSPAAAAPAATKARRFM